MSARPEPSRLSTTSTRLSRVSRRMCEVRGTMGACGIVLSKNGMVMRSVVLAVLGVSVTVAILLSMRPPELPSGARAAAASTAPRQAQGAVLADWRWAGELQRNLGNGRTVLASGGLASESPDFWLDYVRILQGHEHWAKALQRMNVDLLVLDTRQPQIADLVR